MVTTAPVRKLSRRVIMKHPSLRIEGPILSMDIVDRIAEGDFPG